MTQRRYPWGAALAGLMTGLIAFLAAESAVARRVGLDLFLPVAEGAFLPGRLARLGAFLVLGFALALTDRGRAMLAAWDRACQKDRWRWLTAGAVTALFFVWALRVTVLAYMTMDDTTFLLAIAQVPEKGLDATAGVFSSQLLSWALGKLYGLYPDGYWYLGFHLTVLLVSLTVIGRCILMRTCGRGWPAWAGAAIQAGLCAGLFLYCFAAISFTVTPAVAGSAAIALTFCRDGNKTTAGRVTSDIAAAVLLVLSILQRRQTGRAALCFWAVAVGYQLVRMLLARTGLGRTALFAAASLAIALGVTAIGRAEIVPVDPAYSQAENYRSRIVDFLNDELTLEEYEQAGVSRELATLIHGWFFMDEQVTTDLFRDVINIHYQNQTGGGNASALSRAGGLLSRLGNYVRADRQMSARLGFIFAVFLCCAAALIRFGRRYWLELLCALCALGGTGILLLYLVDMGRFPLRVFLVVTLPAAVLLLLTALTAPANAKAPAPSRRRAAGTLAALGAVTAVICCALGAYTTPRAAEAVTRSDVFALQSAIEDLAAQNGDKLIISSVYDHHEANTDPLCPLSDYPENIVQWGYCGDTAKAPEDRLYADAFLRDDVLFMNDRFSTLAALLQYLSVEYGPVQATLTAQLGEGVAVTDIDAVSPGEDYTGWYEQNGMTYYFRDGEALTGEQTIDGETYTFAPAGSEAQFMPVAGKDGAVVYTTDAYSLIED